MCEYTKYCMDRNQNWINPTVSLSVLIKWKAVSYLCRCILLKGIHFVCLSQGTHYYTVLTDAPLAVLTWAFYKDTKYTCYRLVCVCMFERVFACVCMCAYSAVRIFVTIWNTLMNLGISIITCRRRHSLFLWFNLIHMPLHYFMLQFLI